MRCEACGTETKRTDVCDFCGSRLVAVQPPPVSSAPPLDVTQRVPPPRHPVPLDVTQAVPMPLDRTQPVPPQARQVRMTLTGEAVPVDPTAAMPLAPKSDGAGPPYASAAVAPARPLPPTTGLPSRAVGVPLAQSMSRDPDTPTLGARWELALAIFLPIMALSVLLVKLVPAASLWVQFVDFFAVGLALGASSAIPSYDDAFMDCAIVLVLCFLLGPVFTLVVYLIVCAVKQEWNAAILLLLLGNCVVALVVAAAALSSQSLTAIFMVGLGEFLRFFGVIATFAGWMLSNFFRPLNE